MPKFRMIQVKNSLFCAAGILNLELLKLEPLSPRERGRGEGRTVAHAMAYCALIIFVLFANTTSAKPYPAPIPAEGQVIAAFTPEHDIAELIADKIGEAKSEVLVLAYLFTNRKITAALIRAHKRGVKVEVVADREQTFNVAQTTIRDLVAAGVPVWLDNRFAAAHNKLMVIDGATVITGSFNFTQAAQSRNAENVLVSLNARTLAARYLENYQRRKALAQRLEKNELR
jgi:phosphatidylserine/phosphatidylglycerophosphate/cardiolipin synthase-like enzyme